MDESELEAAVERAREHLAALHRSLEDQGASRTAPEIRAGLTELQGVLDKLRARYELLREILARSGDVVFAKDPTGRYMMINQEGARMLGKSVEEVLGQDDTTLYERSSAERIMAFDRLVLDTGRPQTLEGVFHVPGASIAMVMTATAWHEPQGKLRGLIGKAKDVTGRKRAEREAAARDSRLRSLASDIVVAEESLRQSLAADLQNGLGQDIALARMQLSSLRESASDELHDSLIRIERLVEQADRSLRSITFRISPPMLHDIGLVPALQWLGEDIGERYGLDVRVEDEGSPTVSDYRLRVVLFRAVRELLINAAVHGRPGKVRVVVDSRTGPLHITVEDDGIGFAAAEVGLRGRGLFNIREQVEHVGGSLHIDSGAGVGTTVVLTAPRPSREERG